MFFVAPHHGRFAVLQPADRARPVLVSVHGSEAAAKAEAVSLNRRMGEQLGVGDTPAEMEALLAELA